MGFLDKTEEVDIVRVKLTSKGRALLMKALTEDSTFDITHFSFGDSEIDYSLTDAQISGGTISYPDENSIDFKFKLYVSDKPTASTEDITIEIL